MQCVSHLPPTTTPIRLRCSLSSAALTLQSHSYTVAQTVPHHHHPTTTPKPRTLILVVTVVSRDTS